MGSKACSSEGVGNICRAILRSLQELQFFPVILDQKVVLKFFHGCFSQRGACAKGEEGNGEALFSSGHGWAEQIVSPRA